MRTNMLLIAIALTGAMVLAGCGGGGGAAIAPDGGSTGAATHVGTWQLTSDVTPTITESALKDASTDSFSIRLRDNGSVHLAEYCDGEFIANSTGSWSVQGGQAVVSWTACDDVFTIRMEADGLVLVANEGTPDEMQLRFREIDPNDVGNLGQW